jgi:glyoxylase-like metal-dependent hydrolase (beta-lactamase superfamily II)
VSDAETYEILALKYGTHPGRKRAENFLQADQHDAAGEIDYFVWVIRNANRTLVVDTGFDRAEAALRGRRLTHEPREVLALIGVDAERIDTLIVSHLHYDHAGTLGHFPAARFHLQEAEIAYATGRCMCEPAMNRSFAVDHVCEMVRNVFSGRVQFHNGDALVAPGISVHHVPGHSKGLQCVRVLTENGYVVLAVDAAHLYETIETRRPFPVVVDVEQTLRSYDRLAELAHSPAHIVPGHDPAILDRYPALHSRSQGIVHRVDVPRLK